MFILNEVETSHMYVFKSHKDISVFHTLGRGGGNDLSSTSIYPVFMLGRCRYCAFEILIANPIDGRLESNYYFAVN
jgi:hypothetical protein